ncbi:GDP-L-fucose synthase [Saccharibacillus sp. JS10]|uniref:GDP-L-fucose synthase family protein n=1 Tax=Saccharibacillus sp. JS10 TaxID=2950552 RepID=UPI002109FA18|nr:GDP-L-fucose synthase [Saccharibacillus sp. JS10]MCQ4088810.1 GDP-L-fucose synthase [Saccharibacillus sp. JS10]
MLKHAKIFVAGHTGLVGSAIYRKLQSAGYTNLLTQRSYELDLRQPEQVNSFFDKYRPEYIFLAAARVGGIDANRLYPAEFITDNLSIQLNVLQAAHRTSVQKLLFLGSSCIYPKECAQPIKEEYLLTGKLEPTNEPYAIAKIAGIKMCEAYNRQYNTDYLAVMPTNIYGAHDNFNLETAHVLPALIRKIIEARDEGVDEVKLWGTGRPKREFLLSDDLADACVHLMESYTSEQIGGFVNVGTGEDIAISDLARKIADIAGYQGRFVYDQDKPDGVERKRLDVQKINALGWKAQTSLTSGIEQTIRWYEQQSLHTGAIRK